MCNKFTFIVVFFQSFGGLDGFVGMVAPWLDGDAMEAMCVTSKCCNRALLSLKFYKKFENERREQVYRNIMRGLGYYFDITEPELANPFRIKIFSLKFYQISTLISNWEILSRWVQRSMIKDLFFVLRIFYLKKPLIFFPAIILASSLSPGKFWSTWRKYTEHKIFLEYPDFEEEDATTKDLLSRFYMQRGLDGLAHEGKTDLMQRVLGARRFAANLDDDEGVTNFWFEMEDNWNSLAYILHRYSVDPLCHLPVHCTDYEDCQHLDGEHRLAPDTELYNMESGDFHKFCWLQPVYDRNGVIVFYE